MKHARAKAVRFDMMSEHETSDSAPCSSTSNKQSTDVPSLATTSLSSSRAPVEISRLSNRLVASEAEAEERVCNYDSTSITTLYQLMEACDWDGAVERCQTHPDEARTWVVRYQKDSEKVRWKLLPLMTAIIFQSPDVVTQALLEQYPDAVKMTDDQGMTPLHLAFRHYKHDEALLKMLLQACPDAILAKDYRGRSPLDLGMKRTGTYSAKLMHLYSKLCMNLTLQAVDETWRKEIGDEEAIVCVFDEAADDKLVQEECQRDEIVLLETEEREHAAREQPEADETTHQSNIDEYEVDEIAELEKEQQEQVNEASRTVEEVVGPEREQQDVTKVVTEEDNTSPDRTAVAKFMEEPSKHEDEDADDLGEFCSLPDEEFASSEEHGDNKVEDSSRTADGDEQNTQEITSKLIEEHKEEIKTLREYYEERMQAMTDQTMTMLQKMHRDTKAANRAVKEQYSRDMQRIKLYLTQEENKESSTCIQLRDEIIRLQLRLGQVQETKSFDQDMVRDLHALQNDQILLQRLIQDQQKELDTAQAIRALMLKSLWQQDEEEGVARKEDADAIANLADRIRTRLERLSPETPFDETRDAVESTENESYHEDDDDISTITEVSR